MENKPKSNVSKWAIWVIIGSFALIAFTSLLPDPATTENQAYEDEAQEYEVVEVQDYSFPGRDRIRWVITSPAAETKGERAQTAIKAAKDLMDAESPDQANVWLEMDENLIGHGYLLAMATYTPDGKGNSGEEDGDVWEVEASEVTVSDVQIRVAKAWSENRDDFQNDSGFTDEAALKAYIASELDVPEDQVSLPFVTREKVSYE